ncbi:MAG TPA: response regulator FixJ [Stellaceae bacterium]|nr:response regulator FixJ [Stellaceae bacterium]
MPPTVLVADDDEAVRDSLQILLEAAGYRVETYASGSDFLAAARPAGEACLVIDVRMPGLGGLEVQERLQAEGAGLPVVVITGHGDVPLAVRAMKAGAVDFVEKPFSETAILGAVERALEIGRRHQGGGMVAAEAEARVARLSGREREVLDRLVAGKPNKVIAYELSISPRTVEIHRARVMEKTGARSLPELVLMALAAGISPGPH